MPSENSNVTPGGLFTPRDVMEGQNSGNQKFSHKFGLDPRGLGTLGDEYRILARLEGGMGEVFICTFLDGQDTLLALKTFKKQFFFERDYRAAFIREVLIWSELSGEAHIMPIISIENIEGRPYVVMPAVHAAPGKPTTLRELLYVGISDHRLALKYALQIAFGMEQAQARVPGLVHNDLKPENILLYTDEVFITDFGLARVMSDDLNSERLMSTYGYRAPECWMKPDAGSQVSDIYSYGVMLHELVTGAQPFTATSPEEWKRVHESCPVTAHKLPSASLAAALFDLAQTCLHKDPNKRPQKFSDLVQSLMSIGGLHDPEGLIRILPARSALAMSLIGQHFEDRLIRSLIFFNEPEAALRRLSRRKKEDYTPETWLSYGTALAELNRHEEAIECFRNALDGRQEDEEHFIMCMSEMALSFKHLKAFETAEQIYFNLTGVVPESQLPGILVNLATVYIEKGKPDEAITILERLVQTNPALPHAWLNLGIAYEDLLQFQQATDAYRHGLALEPNAADCRVRLARIFMEQLNAPREALESLLYAHRQGFASPELYLRLLHCYLAFGRIADACSLLPELAQRYSGNVVAAAQALLERPSTEAFDRLCNALGETVIKSECVTADVVEGNEKNVPRTDEREDKGNAKGEIATSERKTKSSTLGEIGESHMQIRVYQDSTFSLDFYKKYINADEYVGEFVSGYRQMTRQLSMQAGIHELRVTPFYFTLCSGCGTYILTNRDEGYQLDCCRCGTKNKTRSITSPQLDSLREQVNQALKLKVIELSGKTVWLIIQPLENERVDAIQQMVHDDGFELVSIVDLDSPAQLLRVPPVAMDLLGEGRHRDLFNDSGRVIIARRKCSANEIAYPNSPPPSIDKLIRRIRSEVGAIRSMSSLKDFSGNRALELFMLGEYERAIESIDQELSIDPCNQWC